MNFQDALKAVSEAKTVYGLVTVVSGYAGAYVKISKSHAIALIAEYEVDGVQHVEDGEPLEFDITHGKISRDKVVYIN